uniref:Transmembrane protein n=1 Tax=Glossina austeni TaxID=7395 RepID=A0A1A9USX5_GLOAU
MLPPGLVAIVSNFSSACLTVLRIFEFWVSMLAVVVVLVILAEITFSGRYELLVKPANGRRCLRILMRLNVGAGLESVSGVVLSELATAKGSIVEAFSDCTELSRKFGSGVSSVSNSSTSSVSETTTDLLLVLKPVADSLVFNESSGSVVVTTFPIPTTSVLDVTTEDLPEDVMSCEFSSLNLNVDLLLVFKPVADSLVFNESSFSVITGSVFVTTFPIPTTSVLDVTKISLGASEGASLKLVSLTSLYTDLMHLRGAEILFRMLFLYVHIIFFFHWRFSSCSSGGVRGSRSSPEKRCTSCSRCNAVHRGRWLGGGRNGSAGIRLCNRSSSIPGSGVVGGGGVVVRPPIYNEEPSASVNLIVVLLGALVILEKGFSLFLAINHEYVTYRPAMKFPKYIIISVN